MKSEYRHTLGESCPVSGKGPVRDSFTAHGRPGAFNACRLCHDDQRNMGQRLRDLNTESTDTAV